MKRGSMKASDFRAALWAGAMGYVLGFYAHSFGPDHLRESSSAASGSMAVAMGSGMVVDRFSIAAGVIFFITSLCLRVYVPRKNPTALSFSNLSGETEWPLRRTIVCMVILFVLVPSAGFDLLQRHEAMSRMLLNAPISFRRGEFTSPPFETPATGTYFLSLKLNRALDSHGWLAQKERCQLGMHGGQENDCAGIARSVDFHWKVVGDDGVILQEGTYQPPAKPSPWILLGQFEAKQGKHKRIELNVVRDTQELDVLRPVLNVANMIPGYWESDKVASVAGPYFLYAGLLSYVAVLILVVSLLWQGLSWAGGSVKDWLNR